VDDGRICGLQGREIINQVIDANSRFLSEIIQNFLRYKTHASHEYESTSQLRVSSESELELGPIG